MRALERRVAAVRRAVASASDLAFLAFAGAVVAYGGGEPEGGAAVPEGCRVYRSWPHVRFLREGDPEPPTSCPGCGRRWHGLTRVIRIVRAAREEVVDG